MSRRFLLGEIRILTDTDHHGEGSMHCGACISTCRCRALFSKNQGTVLGQASVTEAIGFARGVYQHTVVSRVDCREAFDE